MRAAYLRLAKWPEEWIKAAILLAIKIYETYYKPSATLLNTTPLSLTSQFGYSVSCLTKI
jgi:hypothetical protein